MNVPSNIWHGKIVAGPNGCHIFTGGISGSGYGCISHNRYAHRAIYEECYGPIPKGMMVLHKCNVKRCVNPLHLYLGTQVENMRDLKETGYTHSAETRAKMKYWLGRKHSEETKLRLRGFSEELVQRILKERTR